MKAESQNSSEKVAEMDSIYTYSATGILRQQLQRETRKKSLPTRGPYHAAKYLQHVHCPVSPWRPMLNLHEDSASSRGGGGTRFAATTLRVEAG